MTRRDKTTDALGRLFETEYRELALAVEEIANRMMGKLGLAWGIRPVPRHVYAEARRSLDEPEWGAAP